jgi:hypothetical protein
LVDDRFTSIDPENGIRRIDASKNTDNWQKSELYLSKYTEMGKVS